MQRNTKPVKKAAKPITKRFVHVFSRHPSHNALRRAIPTKVRALVRFGSTTVPQTAYAVEINTPAAVRNSASKLNMKTCFKNNGVKTPEWGALKDVQKITAEGIEFHNYKLEFPVVLKHIFGSRGRGNYKLDTMEQFKNCIGNKEAGNYIVEQFYNYSREYRLHINEKGCYYPCRKMLKNETPDDKRWYRNDSNCTWIIETNKDFQKPGNWEAIVAESVKALKAVGLDFGAVDVKVQGKDKKGNERPAPEFTIIEINSAPGLGDMGVEIYKKMIPELIQFKLTKKWN